MTRYQSGLLRSLQAPLRDRLAWEGELTLKVALLQAAEHTRAQMLAQLGCDEDDLRAAVRRLEKCRAEYVDLRELMETP